MMSRRYLLPLVVLLVAAGGCKTELGGVTSINEAAAYHDDPDITWFPVGEQWEKQRQENAKLAVKQDKPPPRRLSDLQIRLQSEYIGLTVAKAQSLAQRQGRVFRYDDGPLTDGFMSGRITARTKNGFVKSIEIEEMNPIYSESNDAD